MNTDTTQPSAPTPETDLAWGKWRDDEAMCIDAFVDFARRLERERDDAMADAKSWSEQAEQLATDALAYAKERDELRNYLDASHYAQCNQELRAEVARLREASVHVYNSGYHRGHRDTVEGGYVDIHRSDMPHYHHEEANESLQEALAAVREKEEGK
jgi:hypothetical protein